MIDKKIKELEKSLEYYKENEKINKKNSDSSN